MIEPPRRELFNRQGAKIAKKRRECRKSKINSGWGRSGMPKSSVFSVFLGALGALAVK
jgi:hypothetical protein